MPRVFLLGILLLVAACSRKAPPVPTSATEIPISCTSELAREHLIAAWNLAEEQKRDDALRLVERAHQVDPDCVIVEAWRGYLMPGEEGSRVLAAAAKRTRGLPLAEATLIDALVATRAGDPVAGLEATERLAELMPGAWRAHALYGRRLASFDRPGEAIVELRAATTLAPEQPKPWFDLSQTQTDLFHYAEAADAAVRHAAAKPGDDDANAFAAQVLWTAGRATEAEEHARLALKMQRPSNAWRVVGMCRALAGDRAAAREALTKSVESARGMREAMQARIATGWVEWIDGDRALAATHLADPTTRASPNSIAAWWIGYGGVLLASLRCVDDACPELSTLDRAAASVATLSQKSDDRFMKFAEQRVRIAILARAGKADEARNVAAASVSGEPWETRAERFASAEVLRQQGNWAGAEKAYAECAPEPWCLFELAEVRRLHGNPAGAAEARKALLDAPTVDLFGAHLKARAAAVK